LIKKIKHYLPEYIRVIAQGKYVANSLKNYLERHPEMDEKCTKNGTIRFFTTESPEKFSQQASLFLNKKIKAQNINIDTLC
jgi:glutamate racemase